MRNSILVYLVAFILGVFYLAAFILGVSCGKMIRQAELDRQQSLARRYQPPQSALHHPDPKVEQDYLKRREEIRRASEYLDRMKRDLDCITSSP